MRMKWRQLGIAIGLCGSLSSLPAIARPKLRLPVAPPPAASCPAGLQDLTAGLIKGLPSYANRAYIRAGLRQTYMILAAKPEFEPLPTGSEDSADLKQVFITTLGRTWVNDKATDLQQYHQLFLTRSPTGWQLATMYSMTGPYPASGPPTSPLETSEGSLGEAIRSWLQDCRTGSL
ncbi:MAG: hypothetical protein KME35_12020 [Aphanocapsa sp. GSE-SYN-MK-11-07L]|jgi:hypothetical protein|nr:hypothetical protein [Aphanocapsa sp. GSE-SYN-MK-11-07L]